jgi:hypothetical protein
MRFRSLRSLASDAPARAARFRDLQVSLLSIYCDVPIWCFDNLDGGKFEGDLGLTSEERWLELVHFDIDILLNLCIAGIGRKVVV